MLSQVEAVRHGVLDGPRRWSARLSTRAIVKRSWRWIWERNDVTRTQRKQRTQRRQAQSAEHRGWHSWALGVGLFVALSVGLVAQAPDHSGTWRLNRDASQITKGAGLNGLGASGAPPTLYVAQAANGTAVVGSDINESGAKRYQVSTKGLLLERDGTTEHLSLGSDGKTLTVRITGGGWIRRPWCIRGRTRFVPCEQWPTACRW